MRLGGRAVAVPPSFATEAAVGAVREAGRRTARVGDLGWVFVGGEAGPFFLVGFGFVVVEAWPAFEAVVVKVLGTAEGRLDL